MGMNVNLGTGVNSYTTNALPTTAPKYTSQVQSSLLSQPAYDTVSFSGNYQNTTKKEEGMSTGTKVGLVAAAATLIIGGIAASRGKKLNGEASKGLIDNIGKGLKSMFTKAGRESYKALVKNSDKLDDVAKGALKNISNVTDDMIKNASDDVKKLEQQATDLRKTIKQKQGSLDSLTDKATDDGKKLTDEIKQLQTQLDNLTKAGTDATGKTTQSKIQQAKNKLRELSYSQSVNGDKNFEQLAEAQSEASKKLSNLQEAKQSLQKQETSLVEQINKLTEQQTGKQLLSSVQTEALVKSNDELAKIKSQLAEFSAETGEKSIKAAQEAEKLAISHANSYRYMAGSCNMAQLQYNDSKAAYEALEKTLNATPINLRSADDIKKLADLGKAMKASEEALKGRQDSWTTFIGKVTDWFKKS